MRVYTHGSDGTIYAYPRWINRLAGSFGVQYLSEKAYLHAEKAYIHDIS